ncbi:MAG: GspE/PulE family protein [Deltaproteobacteria bacterium]|nr:GspE/PulE family protein [Deltaproteobacteria bacterium]
MIRNRLVFSGALAALFLAVVARHAALLDGVLGTSGAVAASLPGPSAFAVVAAVLVALSLLPIFGPDRRARGKEGGARFVREDPKHVATRIGALCGAPKPDVPLIVDYTIFQAIACGASDIHFDPSRDGLALKFRVDGIMMDIATIPAALAGHISNRLKVLSNLIIYRGFLPQDGRFGQREEAAGNAETLVRSGLKGTDFRIAFMPTLHGERIVIRILGRSGKGLDFCALGMTDEQVKAMERFVAMPQGMIVLTGPTGSGKTTTIYAALRAIVGDGRGARSIATLEDPIEYELPGLNQSQVDEAKDFTFDKGLRAVLRQDPDVIMVGEIRDPETAGIAIQAGMTGHLIITTVHANNSAATFSRLLEMGCAPYALNSAVTAVIAQRLVRRICPSCVTERSITRQDLDDLGLSTAPSGLKVFTGPGCELCDGQGYHQRHAIFEILEVTEPIRTLVATGASADAIYRQARNQGMMSLFEGGLMAVSRGITSPEEVARVIVRDRR